MNVKDNYTQACSLVQKVGVQGKFGGSAGNGGVYLSSIYQLLPPRRNSCNFGSSMFSISKGLQPIERVRLAN